MKRDLQTFDDIPLSFGPMLLTDILGISKTQAYALVNRPDFPKLRIGKKIIISKDHFLKWLDEQINKDEGGSCS